MKRTAILLLILPALVAAVAVGFFLYDRQDVFTGERVRDPDCYTLVFEKMNQTDSHTLTLGEGDVLSVDFAVDRGRADLFIGIPGEEEIYRANELGSGTFELIAPKEGDYRITVRAKHAAGYIRIFARKAVNP